MHKASSSMHETTVINMEIAGPSAPRFVIFRRKLQYKVVCYKKT